MVVVGPSCLESMEFGTPVMNEVPFEVVMFEVLAGLVVLEVFDSARILVHLGH